MPKPTKGCSPAARGIDSAHSQSCHPGHSIRIHCAVVSKGDNELLQLDGHHAWHFPQTAGGVYAGCHPKDSADAIQHLAELRTKGAEYLLFPKTAFWWLDHYAELKNQLESRHTLICRDDACVIYGLTASADPRSPLLVRG